MSDPVRSPGLRQCCSAAVELIVGTLRPRRVDERFIRSVADAGLPTPGRTVTVTALPQVPRSVPTAAIVEGTFTPRRIDNAMTSFVVTHPEATFVVDPALCVDVEERAIAQLPAVLRVAVHPPADAIPTVTGLTQLALPPVDFALPTHAHWDHICGLLDFPGLPVHLHRTEREWVDTGPIAPVGGVRDAMRDRPLIDYELDGPPVSTFTRSHDLFGDSSVILVDLRGHTPGSVGVLAHTAHRWVLIAGDAAWHQLQVEHARQKSAYPGVLVDEDRDETFKTLQRLHLARHTVRVIPTHDHQAALKLSSSPS
jgi:glyoxylase-like metal-dependent hydrolase (beta-lactamase superfamily II)